MKIHLLRRESVTPIALYLARRDEQPESFDRQLEFANVLLYREREYRSMYRSGWLMRRARPGASPDSPFQPYDLTPEAANNISALIDQGEGLFPPSPDDLFGLKRSALAGLRRTLRPVKVHAFGWLVASRLHDDLGERAEAAAAAARAGDLGEAKTAGALLGRRGSSVKAIEALEERIRRRALAARGAVEGAAFTRYLTTEGAFCEQQRAAALAGFDESRVPAELRPLVPLARQIGVGDDACRGWFMRKVPARDRRAAKALITEHGEAIDAWLATRDEPYEAEATAFFWLREAGEEL